MSLTKVNPKDIQIDPSRNELLTQVSLEKLKGGYMREGETCPQESFARACAAFGSDLEHAQRLYDYVSQLWFMFASPVLSNGGTDKGLPISCYLSECGDSIEGLLESYQESSWISVLGGGVGIDYSNVRSKGTPVKNGGTTPGLIPFLKTVDSQMNAYQQGSMRRGSAGIYLDVSHPEIEEFITLRKPTGTGDANRKCLNQGFNNAVNIPDAFMEAIEQGSEWDLVDPKTKKVTKTVAARDLWRKILDTRLATGEPYLHFQDTSNRALPQALKDKGLKIHGSNLCVAPETLILTEEHGYTPISSLENQEVCVWNGLEFTSTTVRKTGENKELVRVSFNDGSSIDCTPEHKFYVQETRSGAPREFRASDLYSGAKMEKFDLPTEGSVFNVNYLEADPKTPYSKGFYAGDGNENYSFSWVYPAKHCVTDNLTGTLQGPDSRGRMKWKHGITQYGEKFDVPFRYVCADRLLWLAGLFDADGCVTKSTNCDNIQLCSVKPDFLRKIKLFLQEMGVPSSVRLRRLEGEYPLPKNDGTGELKLFECQEVWMLIVNGIGVQRLLDLGLRTSRLEFQEEQNPQRDSSRFVEVVSVERTGRISDTFCFTEEGRHRGMFNGILTGQCSEIFLPTNTERTAVCCLSSLNLEKYSEWKNHPQFVGDIVEMLDNVLEDFINKCPKPMWRAKLSAERERSIGLGTLGLHAYLQSQSIAFESAEALTENEEIFRNIKTKATQRTQELAISRGEAPDMEGTGVRNAHLMAIAPNATSSIICGNTSPSIEPFSTNYYRQVTNSGSFFNKNKFLEILLEDIGHNTEDVWDSILGANGSVQHLPYLTDHEKMVFKTARELDQEWLVTAAAVRQPHICQGQSLNLFILPNTPFSTIHKIHKMAWEQGLKGLYYCRSLSEGQMSKTSLTPSTKKVIHTPIETDSTCTACEA